jgi:hypothetical protein
VSPLRWHWTLRRQFPEKTLKLTKAGIRLPFVLSATVLLAGCLAPEKFKAEITTSGYEYRMRIESTLADPRAVMAAAEGRLSEQDDEAARRLAAKDAHLPGFERLAYVGEGRFELVVNLAGSLEAAGAAVGFPNTRAGAGGQNYITIHRLEDGTILISSPETTAQNLAQLEQLPFRPSGTVRIVPDPADRVVEHNADRAASFLDRAYVWNLDSWADQIFIRIEPKGD